MKIFVTGHSSGIGKATYDLLTEFNHTVYGGSRSNGWDVSDIQNYPDVLDCDVLINNAYHKTGQLELLKFVYDNWQGQNKIIINVGSAHKDYQINRPLARLNYNVTKKSLETYSFWISENDNNCKSMMYNPGFVDTPLARFGMDDWPLEEQQRVLSKAMDPTECAKTIMFMILNKHTFKEVVHI